MKFYKSKNATISERLTGISKKDGFEVARNRVDSGLFGAGQKEADLWFLEKWINRNWWKVVSGIVVVASGITKMFEFFFK